MDLSEKKKCRWRVGFWVTEKKAKKLSYEDFRDICRNVEIDLVQLDLLRDLEAQGPFDAIVHKFTDVIAGATLEHDAQALEMSKNVFSYVESHLGDALMVDPVDMVRQLCDRFTQYNLINKACVATDRIRTPSFALIDTHESVRIEQVLSESNVTFPVVCKPLVAHGSDAHRMALVFCKERLGEIQIPFVAQTFIPHNAVLYKVYIIGDKYHVFPRPSLKNFKTGSKDKETICFYSHEVSKEGCSSYLTEQDEEKLTVPTPSVNDELIGLAVRSVVESTGLSLFGLDIIIDPKTEIYYIIDANTFPSYDGIPDFFSVLADHLQKRLLSRTPSRSSRTFQWKSHFGATRKNPHIDRTASLTHITSLETAAKPSTRPRLSLSKWTNKSTSDLTDSGCGSDSSTALSSPFPSDSDSDNDKKRRAVMSLGVGQTENERCRKGAKQFYGIPKPVSKPRAETSNRC